MNYNVKINFYILMIVLVVKNQNKKVFNGDDISREVGNEYFNIVANKYDNKEIVAKIRGAKTNANTVTSFNHLTGEMTVPDAVFDFIKKREIVKLNSDLYLMLNEEEYIVFNYWLKTSGINKNIYINSTSFVNTYINKLKKEIKLKELLKGKGNKVPDKGEGSLGIASKIYYYEKDGNIETLSGDKIFFSYSEIYNKDHSFNYECLWNILKKTNFIKKSIEIFGEEIVKKDFFSFKL